MTMQIGTDDPIHREPNDVHSVCSNCACGHWRGGRHATLRPEGRRGRALDVIEGNDDGSR